MASSKHTSAQLETVDTELVWPHHAKRHALLHLSLDSSIKLSKVKFPGSEVASKISSCVKSQQQKTFPLSLRFLDMKSGSSNHLDFYEVLIIHRKYKTEAIEIVSKYKLVFAQPSACAAVPM